MANKFSGTCIKAPSRITTQWEHASEFDKYDARLDNGPSNLSYLC